MSGPIPANIVLALRELVEGRDLSATETEAVFEEIMGGQATPAQIGAFLAALRMKGETVEEIAGAATVMRRKAHLIRSEKHPLIDTCGTGGDGASTFNISTTAAFVVAGAGVAVAKHGNRAVSSQCGSADLLGAMGINIDLDPRRVEECLSHTNFGFLFAPKLHAAMKHAVGPRREMGIRTLFNLLGPLTNPAGARRQLLGVFSRDWVRPLAETLGRLGAERAMVVHGADGLDEITLTGPTHVAELKGGTVTEYGIDPETLGFSLCRPEFLAGGGPEVNLAMTRDVLDGAMGPHRDIVLLNAGAALVVSGVARDMPDGIERARKSIDSGAAARVVQAVVAFSNRA